MEKRDVFNRMISAGLIPVIRVSTANEAMDVANAVKEGGVSVIEIEITTTKYATLPVTISDKYWDDTWV